MYQTGRSYDYYDMKADDQEETENKTEPKPEKTFSNSKIETNVEEPNLKDESPLISTSRSKSHSSKEELKSNEKETQKKLENGSSQEKNIVFDPSKYMKVYNKSDSGRYHG